MDCAELGIVWCESPPADSVQELCNALARRGFHCGTPDNAPHAEAWVLVVRGGEDVVWTRLPRSVRDTSGRVLVVAISGKQMGPQERWNLLAEGAADVLEWDSAENIAAVIAAKLERWQEVDRLVGSRLIAENLVGRSRAWLALMRRVVEVAHFSEDSIVLIGETGTGKELIARLIGTWYHHLTLLL